MLTELKATIFIDLIYFQGRSDKENMAKKGGKGEQTSKKAEQKKKQKILEDKTFGLKNKNKSKKVQNYIESTTKSVMNTGDRKQRQLEEQRKKQKAEAKIRKKALKDEQNALFGEALMAIGKKKGTNMKDGKQEAKGRDHGDEGTKKGTSRAMKMMYQMDAKEMEERLKEDVSNCLPCYLLCLHLAFRLIQFSINIQRMCSPIMFQPWRMRSKHNVKRRLLS